MKIILIKPIVVLLHLFVVIIFILSGCDLYDNWRNDEPTINSFDIPEQVQYGETVEFSVSAYDPEDDTIIYSWHVSDGVLQGDTEPIVQWTAPVLVDDEIAPPKTVTVRVSVKDEGEELISKSESILVFSKAYEVANAISGEYDLVLTQVDGETVNTQGGVLRLTTSTFTRQFEENLQFFSGAYKLVEPFDENKGTISWYVDGIQNPTNSTYTWDGKLLVIYWNDTSTADVYNKK